MSFPNPGMLPLSEAGGALSGANFGVFYTVLMQVGYKHFAPRVLEQIKKGMPLFEALQLIQAELRPFNDRIIADAVDRLPTMFDITVEMLEKFLVAKGGQLKENIETGAFNPFKNLFPSLPEAEARLSQSSQQAQFERLNTPTVIITDPEKRQQQFRDKRQAEILAKIKREARGSSRNIPDVHQIIQAKNVREGVTILRKAGQTQIQKRNSLIKMITYLGRVAVSQRNKPGLLRGTKVTLKRFQIELIGLQQRYRF